MKFIKFNSLNAQKIYDRYINSVERKISILSEKDREDILMEFNSHIYEGLVENEDIEEVDYILEVTESLGSPEKVLQSVIAEKKLNEATKTFNPVHVATAIFLNLKNGFIYIFFAILYLCLFLFTFLIYSKIRFPDQTGLFFSDNKFVVLGRLTTTEPVQEVLGSWFIPVMILVTLVLYVLITLLLRIKRKR